MIESYLLAISLFAAFALLVSLFPKSPADMEADFSRECRRQGMTWAETFAAVAIRINFVRLRRLASNRCVEHNGRISRGDIDQIAGDLALGISMAHGQEAAKTFLGWVASCPDEEILYDDARHARTLAAQRDLAEVGLWPPKPRKDVDPDYRDAFKIIKK